MLHLFPALIYCALAGPTSVAGVVALVLWSPGAIHGLCLLSAGRRVTAIQEAMTDEERDALPEPPEVRPTL